MSLKIWKIVGVCCGALLLIGATAAATVLLTRERAGDPQPASHTSAPVTYPFTVNGFMTLDLGDFVWNANPDVCTGRGGYDDIKGGTQIAVRDAAGTTIALGQLGDGVPRRNPADPNKVTECRFPFKVTGVPGGLTFYKIEIADRGELEYTQDQLARSIELTLG